MTKYLLAALAFLAIAACAVAGFQSMRLADVRNDLTTTQTQLADAVQTVDRISRSRAVLTRTLADDRERAVQAERLAGDLREMIARDAGTDRDGQTAPVLRDAIVGLQKTISTRQDAHFMGRMPAPYRLVVTVDGKLERVVPVRGFPACREVAATVAVELSKRPELVAHFRRASIRCLRVSERDRA